MKPRLYKVWNGAAQRWGWAVARGWWVAWGADVRSAWAAWEGLTANAREPAAPVTSPAAQEAILKGIKT